MNSDGQFDYIVVGSGAGGGTLAARLAEGGRSVLLLEAGGDPRQLSGTNDDQPGINRLPDDYDVPSFHGFASENDAMRWDFFVRHYASDAMQQKDPKYRRDYRGVPVDGVLYPRAGTLGGCTAHNAMILVYPHNADWDGIARLTGDQSWNAENMRQYFMRLENCHYRPLERALAAAGPNPSRHGWHGWLQVGSRDPKGRGARFRTGAGVARLGARGVRRYRAADRAPSRPGRGQGRSERLAAGDRKRSGRALHAAGDARSCADGRARAGTGDGAEIPGPPPGGARRARHPGAARRKQPRDRRRIPEGRAALPRPWPACDHRGRTPSGAGYDARSSSAAARSIRRKS